MSAFISELTASGAGIQSLSLTNLWDNVNDIAPLVIVLVLFSLARRIINKNLRAASKGTSGKI